MAVFHVHKDDDPLMTGTHKGADAAGSLSDAGENFLSCGIIIGLAIHNDTQGTDGLVTAVTEDGVTDDTNTWDNGDTYSIYKTAAKDTVISRIATDRIRGKKVTRPEQLNSYGYLPKDSLIDLDEDGYRYPKDRIPFGPGQPEKRRHR